MMNRMGYYRRGWSCPHEHCKGSIYGKAFVVREENGYSQKNFRNSRLILSINKAIILRGKFHNGVKDHENHKSFPPRKFCCIWYVILAYTVVWKIFVWNYFVVENVRENNFMACQYPRKYFNNR